MKRKFAFLLLCLIFLAVAIFAGAKVVTILLDYKAGVDTYEDLQQYIYIETPQDKATPAPEETEEESSEAEKEIVWPTVDFDALQAINEDVVGWIYIEGTAVNYPIVKGPDNNYYLRRMIDGAYNNAGSIFMDYRNHSGFGNQHTILYGHHMDNGSMFADILEYKDQAFYDEHPVCLILTPSVNYTLEFFTGYVADTSESAWDLNFSTDGEFYDWIQSTARKSYFASEVIPTSSDRIVTLSTCSYEFDDARFVIAGVLRPAN